VTASIRALHCCNAHTFSKAQEPALTLLAGLGVYGDAHCGSTVKHRSRVAIDPNQPNLRQVHLLSAEILEALNAQGYRLKPGDLGENVTTTGVDLHALPTGTLLRLGDSALIALTGLRNPCHQIESFRDGLLRHVVSRDRNGNIVRRAGVMAIVVQGGDVHCGDLIVAQLPPPPHTALARV
jgi:MOSC domain-containing protein YiiM